VIRLDQLGLDEEKIARLVEAGERFSAEEADHLVQDLVRSFAHHRGREPTARERAALARFVRAVSQALARGGDA
jgi:polyhydroxyalkanoate synthesis regulator phasin